MDIKQSDFSLLVALNVLLEAQSVTRAAQSLGISQPAMSAQLARLRHLFNDPLLTPSGRKLIPTARALEITEPLKTILADLDLLVRESTHFEPGETDRIFRLIGTDYVHAVVAPDLQETFGQEAPTARLALLPLNPPDVWQQLERDEADLALVTGMDLPEARRRMGLEETFKFIQRKNHPRGIKPCTVDEFCAAEHLLISPEGGGFFGATDKILADLGKARRIVSSVPSFLLAPAMVAATDLIGMIPARLAAANLDTIDCFDPPFPSPRFSVDILWHPRRQNDPGHVWLRTLVSRVVSRL